MCDLGVVSMYSLDKSLTPCFNACPVSHQPAADSPSAEMYHGEVLNTSILVSEAE